MQQNPINSGSNNNNTKLLLEESAASSWRGRKRKVARVKSMKKQSNRLATRSSHLLDNFSEFLASRNVINRTSRYDILVSDSNNNNDDDEYSNNERLQYEQQMLFPEQVIFPETLSSSASSSSSSSAGDIQQRHTLFRRHNSQQNDRYSNQPITYKYYDCLRGKKPGRVKSLISALFSREQNNKTSLLLSLLKAPIVLAAMFSLILVVTLMILYTMSFHHYNCHHHVTNQQQQQQQQQQLHHHINSRQLQQQQETGEKQQAEFDADDETSEKNVSSDYSNFSNRKLSSKQKGEKLVSHFVKSDHRKESVTRESLATTIKARKKEEKEERSYERAITVQTECGSFVGSPEGKAIVFRGIAYATPPISGRRWTRPRPVWQDPELCNPKQTKLALHSRIHCAQLSPVTRRFSGHEDCLYLDIFTPKLNDRVKKLPVMVYIHGGFLTFGSSGHGQVNWLKGRPSAKLASELNVVLVSFNYRLQALGFMTLVQLAQNNGPDGSEGNYGLWDQLTALNWIKRNIESFAGDSNNIVLFGPDSASALPLALISQQRQQLEEVGAVVSKIDIKEGGERERKGEEEDVKEFKKRGGGVGEEEVGDRKKGAKIGRESSGNLVVGVEKERKDGREADGVVGSTINQQEKQQIELKISNQIDIDRQEEHLSLYSDRDLFRAVWLTNPTVYYELPYEIASKHYQNLFLKQSPCLRHLVSKKAPIIDSENSLERTESPPLPPSLFISKSKSKSEIEIENEKLNDKRRQEIYEKKPFNSQPQAPSDEMIECLVSLSSEQVVRHYLREDDPSYRLDDQNSLPIHGIFADQFITVDRELVQDSYPFFSNLDLISKQKSSSKLTSNFDEKNNYSTDNFHNHHNENNPRQQQQKNETSNDCYNSNYCNQNIKHHLRPKMVSLFRGKDILLGSTAQAVEYWPCPRNLDQWNWEDFERYVSTSLNSFSRDTFKVATEMYNVSPGQLLKLSKFKKTLNPKEIYLTMVSDIRQICPINELADSMLDRNHNVHRYIVETNPSSQAIKNSLPQLHNTTTSIPRTQMHPTIQKLDTAHNDDQDDLDPLMLQYKPEFAHHTWDLFAFFGFEFDPDFVPQERDLKFQFHIRQMVRRFVHRKNQASSDIFSDSSNVTSTTKSSNSGRYKLYTKNGTTLQISKYKFEECNMWRKYIEKSYAWVS